MNTEPRDQSGSDNRTGGHDALLKPPPAAVSGEGSSGDAPRESRGSGTRAAAIAIAALGGVALLATGGNAAFAAVNDVAAAANSQSADIQSAGVDGVESLSLEIEASSATVRFGDVDEATLEVTGSRAADWRLERDDDELIVRGPDRGFGWWFGGDWFARGWAAGHDAIVVLTLPKSLERAELDADFVLDAGSLEVDGSYGEVEVEVGAGGFDMEGSATSIDLDLNAGSADLSLFDVTEADFRLSAGKIVAEIANTAPRSVAIDVSAGTLELTLPDEAYALTQNVSVGSLENRLNTSSDSRHDIDARVAAGDVILRAAD